MARKQVKRSRRRRVLWLLFRLALVALIVIGAYGVYLDQQIRSRIDGKVWQLPAAVYGRMVSLEPGMNYSKKRWSICWRACSTAR